LLPDHRAAGEEQVLTRRLSVSERGRFEVDPSHHDVHIAAGDKDLKGAAGDVRIWKVRHPM
jgi:hypothetical protein